MLGASAIQAECRWDVEENENMPSSRYSFTAWRKAFLATCVWTPELRVKLVILVLRVGKKLVETK